MSLRINHSGDSSDPRNFELSNGQAIDVSPNDLFKIQNPEVIANLIPQGKDVLVMSKDGSTFLLKNFLLNKDAHIDLPGAGKLNASDFEPSKHPLHDDTPKAHGFELKFDSIPDPSSSSALQSVTILSVISQLAQNTSAFANLPLSTDGDSLPGLRERFQTVELSSLASNSSGREREQTAQIAAQIASQSADAGLEEDIEDEAAADKSAKEKSDKTQVVSLDDAQNLGNDGDPHRVRVPSKITDDGGDEVDSETVVDSETGSGDVVNTVDDNPSSEPVETDVVVVDPADDKVIDRKDPVIALPDPFEDDNVSLSLSRSEVVENDAGTVIGSLDAFGVDKEIDGPFTYSIVNDEAGIFEIAGDTLKLRDGVSIDFETAPDRYGLTILIENADGKRIEKSVSLTPADANDTPSINEFTVAGQEDSLTLFERAAFEQAFSDIDDGDSLESIRIDSLPDQGDLRLGDSILSIGQTVSIEQLSEIVFDAPDDWNGQTSFRWSGFDGTDWSTKSATVSVAIESINDAPVATIAIGSQTANEDAAFSFALPEGLFSDADLGDSLTLTAQLPSWLAFDPANGTISGTPAYETIGNHRIVITATDKSGASATTSFDLNVENVNDRPAFTRIADVSIAENDLIDIEAGSHFSDEDASLGDSLAFSASLADGSELPDWIQIDQETGRITGTPPQGLDTDIEIRVTATDASELSASTVFNLHVANLNDAPELASPIEDVSTPEDTRFYFDVSSSFADSDLADTLTFSATLPDGTPLPDWLIFDTVNGVFTGLPENGDVGMIPVAVTASDGEKSAQDMFAIMVQNTNDGPVALGISNQKTNEDQPFALDVSSSFSDLDAGDTLTYSASLINGSELPDWLEFNESTGVFSGVPNNEDVGELSILVVASDGESNANSIFSIEVENTNDGPVASYLPPQSITEDSQFLFDASIAFSDHDHGDELSYSATLENGDPLPSWISINRFTGELTGAPTNAEVGSLSITVTASDGDASASTTFSVTVQNTNDGPIVSTGISDQSVAEDSPFTLDIAANFADADLGDTLAFTATLADGSPLPSWLSFDASTGRFSGTPSNEDVGKLSIIAIADDGEATAETSFALEVENTNDAPAVWTTFEDVNTNEGSAFSIDLSSNFGDTDSADILSFTATLENGDPLPAWLSIDPTTGVLSGTPENEDVGNISIKVTATDPAGATASDTFGIQISNTNDGPVAAAIADQSATEDVAFSLDASAAFSDIDADDTLTFTATLANGDPLPTWLSIDPTTGLLSGTPENEAVGNISIKVTATDSAGATASDTFGIQISHTNNGPVAATIEDQSVTEDAPFSLDASASFSDIDAGDTLTFSATLENGDPLPSWLSIDPATGVLSGTPENADVRNISIKVTATDSAGAIASNTFGIQISNTNNGPVAATIEDQSVTEDAPFSLDASASFSDIDAGDTLTFSATLEYGDPLPIWLSIDPATGVLSGTPENEDVGNISVTVTATDSAGDIASQTFGIQISNTNDGPVATAIEDQSATEDAAFTLDAASSFSDPDLGDTLAFEATLADGSPLPNWLAFDEATGKFTGVPNNDDIGSFEVTVTATDGELVLERSFSITVENINDAPVASADSISAEEDGQVVSGNLISNDSDSDTGDSLAISAINGSPLSGPTVGSYGTLLLSENGDYEYSVDNDNPLVNALGIGQALTETFVYEIQDASGAKSTSSLTITINGSNDAVSAVVDSDPSANTISENAVGSQATGLTATTIDPDSTDTVTYSVDDERFTVDLDGAVRVAEGATFDAETEASVTIAVTATSSDGSTSTESFNIDINDVDEYDVSAVSDIDAAANAIDEDADQGQAVGIVATANDDDATDTVTYSVDDERFTVDPDGTVRVAEGATFDAETEASVTIAVTATSSDGSTSTETFSIDINDVDEYDVSAVSDIDAAANAIDEDADQGQAVGIVATANDADATDTVTYSVDDERFTVDPDGTVRVAEGATFDAETEASVTIAVTATSTDGSTSTETFSIDINDVDEADVSTITDTDQSENSVDETVEAGERVGITAAASDADLTNNGVSFSLSNNPSGVFAIDSATGVITIADPSSIDFEATPVYHLEITATSEDGSSSSQTFQVSINDINEAPTVTPITSQIAVEDAAFSLDASASFSDIDAGDTLTFSATLADGNPLPSWLSIDPTTGVLSGTPENENVGSLSITVTATDAAGAAAADTFGIQVSNTNDGPVATAIADQSAIEDAAFSLDTSASFSDLDAGDTLAFTATLADGDPLPAWLSIDPTTGILSGTPENGDVGSISVTVTATDLSGASDSDSFGINVESTNDAPTAIASIGNSATENSAGGTVVATLSTTDQDVGDSHTYQIVDEDGTPLDHDLFEVVGNEIRVRDGADVDYESAASHQIRILVTDTSGGSYQDTISIDVQDVNEAPTDIAFTTPSKSQSVEAEVSNASITTGNGGGQGTASVLLDNATAGSEEIVIEMSTVDNSFDIEINGESISDKTIQLQSSVYNSSTQSFLEFDDGSGITDPWIGNDNGLSRIRVVITNEGVEIWGTRTTSSSTYEQMTLNGSSLNAPSLLDGANQVTIINPDDHGADGINATVSATYDQQVASELLSESDGNAIATVSENAPGETVVELSATDPDSGDSISFSLAEDSSGLFEVVGNTLKLKDGESLDYEDQDSHQVTVRATDSEGRTYDETITINVQDESEAPILENEISDQVATEDLAFSFTIPEGTFTDEDAGDSLSYSATMADGSDLPDWIAFDPDTGAFSGTPQNADVGIVSVKVTATDDTGASVSETFDIDVENTNDGPVALSDSGLTASYYNLDSQASNISQIDFDATPDFQETVSSVDFNAGFGNVYENGPSDNVAIRYQGDVVVDESGQWSFKVTGDDGYRLSVDGQIVVANEGVHDSTSATGSIQLESGPHSIELLYFEAGRESDLKLEWKGPSDATYTVISGEGLGAVYDPTAAEDEAFSLDTSALFFDEDAGDSLTFTATLADGDPLPSWLTIDSTTGILSGTPENADVGSFSVTVTATDLAGSSAVKSFGIQISNTNDGPVATAIADHSATEDAAFSLDASAAFSDIDAGDTLTFTATLENGDPLPAWLSIDPATGVLSGTPENADVGSISVIVTATDSAGATASDTFGIQISNTNDGPVAAAIADQSATEDAAFSLDTSASFSDIDAGDTLTFSATLENGDPLPAWISIDPATGVLSGTPENEDVGSLSIIVTATDSAGAAASDTFGIQISNTNDGPVATAIADHSAIEDAAFSLDASAAFSDIDAGDTLTFTATLENDDPLPAWISIDPATGVLSGTPENEDVGSLSITVTATDAAGAAASDTFGIQISNTNDGPVATAIADQEIDRGEAFQLDLSSHFDDPDAGDSLSYTVSLADGSPLPSWLSYDAASGLLSGTPSQEDSGSLSIRVVASDGASAAETSFDLDVNAIKAQTGTAVDDSIQGDDYRDEISGGLGSDTIEAGAGDDTVYGDDATGASTSSGHNYIVNGSFEDVAGGSSYSWGVSKGEVDGWTDAGNSNFEMHASGWEGMAAPTDGNYFLDMSETPGLMDISQTVQGLGAGESYELTFDAGDRTSDLSNSMEVYFGGQLIATIDPQTTDVFESYSFQVTGGMGDGSDTLRFVGLGANDNHGISLDNVRLQSLNDDTIDAGAGDDTITGGSGNDLIDGGAGADTVVYSGNRDDYSVTDNGEGSYSIVDSVSDRDGSDTVSNVEYVRFADGVHAIQDLIDTPPVDPDVTHHGDYTTEFITTGSGNDTIYTHGGDDVVDAGDGDNVVVGDYGSESITTGSGNDTITASWGADIINSGDGNDTVYAAPETNDIINTEGGDDAVVITEGYAFGLIDGGEGEDTLVFDTSGNYLDFTNLPEGNQLSNFERIDIDGHGANYLKLSAEDVLDMTDGNNRLFIDGSADDTVEFSSSFANQGVENRDGHNYNHYYDATTDTHLYINTDISDTPTF